MLTEGTIAPPFTLPDQDEVPVTAADFRGRWLVFWWYVIADTGG